MKASKLVTILSKRRDKYQANVDTLQNSIDIIIGFEMHKGLVFNAEVVDRDLGPDYSYMEELTLELVKDIRKSLEKKAEQQRQEQGKTDAEN